MLPSEAEEKLIAGSPDEIAAQIVAEAKAVAEDVPNGDHQGVKMEEAAPNAANEADVSGINFLFDDDSSDDEAMVTIGEIVQNHGPKKAASGTAAGKLDVDGQPTINGQLIYDVDLASMEDKPWQKPGADLTDYFNYGFNEETWNLYCERQKKLRAEFGSQKEVNRAILGSINYAPVAPQIPVLNQGGRQLVNVVGPDKPQKVSGNFMTDDFSRPSYGDHPVKIMPVVRTVIAGNSTPQSSNFDNASLDTSGTNESSIPVVNFSKPPPHLLQSFGSNSPSSSPLHNAGDGPPGPPQFNNLGRVPPLMGRDFRRRGSSDESDDEYSRRKRRRRSRSVSPRRRRDDRSRDYRDERDRDSSRSRRHEDRGHKRSRYEDYDRDKRRKHERSDRSERSGRTRDDDRNRSEDESEAPPGMD
ncbi:FIP1-like 1 protein [Aphelenchoides fujianensis]|nr:FIP1-like 1 protein [Aphelenchoides fujianensis]